MNQNALLINHREYFDGEEGDVQEVDDGEDSEGGEYRPDDENYDEPEEEFAADADAAEGDDEERGGEDEGDLPPKKRGRPKKIVTDAEIEEATKAAMASKPVVMLDDSANAAGDEDDEGSTGPNEGEEQKGEKEKNPEPKKDVSAQLRFFLD